MRKAALLTAFFYATLSAISQAGTLDTTIGGTGIVRSNLFNGRGPATARKTFVQPDGTLLIVLQEDALVLLTRLTSDGNRDPSYYPYYSSTLIYGDAAQDQAGNIVVAGTRNHNFALTRFDAGGTTVLETILDFPDSAVATAVALQADGKIVMAGYAYSNGIAHFALARCYADGRLDSTFSDDGRLITAIGNNGAFATCVALQADGKIVVGGHAGGYRARRNFAVVRYNPNGSRDVSFSNDGKQLTAIGMYADVANALAIQADGKILLTGRTQIAAGTPALQAMATVRYSTTGSLDATFNRTGIVVTAVGFSTEAVAVLVQADAKIILAARAGDFFLLRYKSDGSLDGSFGQGSMWATDFNNGADRVSTAQLTNGKILVTGWTDPGMGKLPEIALALYTAEGKPDMGFSGDGKVNQYFSTSSTGFACTAVQADGKLLAAGFGYDTGEDYVEATILTIARYNPDGSFDTSFGVGGRVNSQLEGFGASASAMALQKDGKIVIGGSIYNFESQTDFILIRYTSKGIIDSSFGDNGVADIDFKDEVGEFSEDELGAITIQPDGKIVAVGMTDYPVQSDQMAVARCNSDGSLDAKFSGNGKQTIHFTGAYNERANAVALQLDGKIVLAGTTFADATGNEIFAVARLNTDGTLDRGFSGDGKLTTAFGPASNSGAGTVAIQTDKKIVVGGSSNGYFALTRYYPNGNLDLSFSGDGKQTSNFGGSAGIRAVQLLSQGRILAAGTGQGQHFFALAQYTESGKLDSSFATNGKQTTVIEGNQDQVGGIAVFGNRLYVAGNTVYEQNDISIGIVASYHLEGNTVLTKAVKSLGQNEVKSALTVNAFPNPATQYFTIKIKTASEAPIGIRVTDVQGRTIEVLSNVAPNKTLQLGHHYKPGEYYLELLQEGKRAVSKLIKTTQ